MNSSSVIFSKAWQRHWIRGLWIQIRPFFGQRSFSHSYPSQVPTWSPVNLRVSNSLLFESCPRFRAEIPVIFVSGFMLIKKGRISREATEQSVQKISTKASADTTNCFQPFLPDQDYHSKKRRHKTLKESYKLFNTTYTDANAVDFAWLMIIEWIYVGDVSL